jgi:hypothetical protein
VWTQSPAAHTRSTLVAMRRSTTIAPRSLTRTPALGASSLAGLTPTATSTRSAATSRSGARKLYARQRRSDGHGAGADHEHVVTEVVLLTVEIRNRHGSCDGIDGGRFMVEEQPQAERLEIVDRPVGQHGPLGSLAAQVEGDAADAEVWIRVADHQGDRQLRRPVLRPQPRHHAGIASPDDDEALFDHGGTLEQGILTQVSLI